MMAAQLYCGVGTAQLRHGAAEHPSPVLGTRYPALAVGCAAEDVIGQLGTILGGAVKPGQTLVLDDTQLLAISAGLTGEFAQHVRRLAPPRASVNGRARVPVLVVGITDDEPHDVSDTYLRLHLLTSRLISPGGCSLKDIFNRPTTTTRPLAIT